MVEKNTVKGALKEASGKVKGLVGKATGDKSLQAEGAVEEAAGKAQRAVGSATSTVKSKLR